MSVAVTVSEKYQIVVPKAEREKIGLRPGQRMLMEASEQGILLLPIPKLESLRGIVKKGTHKTLLKEVKALRSEWND